MGSFDGLLRFFSFADFPRQFVVECLGIAAGTVEISDQRLVAGLQGEALDSHPVDAQAGVTQEGGKQQADKKQQLTRWRTREAQIETARYQGRQQEGEQGRQPHRITGHANDGEAGNQGHHDRLVVHDGAVRREQNRVEHDRRIAKQHTDHQRTGRRRLPVNGNPPLVDRWQTHKGLDDQQVGAQCNKRQAQPDRQRGMGNCAVIPIQPDQNRCDDDVRPHDRGGLVVQQVQLLDGSTLRVGITLSETEGIDSAVQICIGQNTAPLTIGVAA